MAALILVDLGPAEPLLIFVEVVAAYANRDDGAFKGSVSEPAWRSFAWFVSEPDHIMVLHRGADAGRALLSELMRG